MVQRRKFLEGLAACGMAGCAWGTPAVQGAPGFEGFARTLAEARTCWGATTLHVRESRLLDAWSDDETFRIVRTGRVEKGVWHLRTRGICMEFMLRLEVMGPHATTPHPRAGQPWEPVVNVGCARRLMERMLRESGVEIAYSSVRGPAFAPSSREVSGDAFIRGQTFGTEQGLYRKLGSWPSREVLAARLARDFALPG